MNSEMIAKKIEELCGSSVGIAFVSENRVEVEGGKHSDFLEAMNSIGAEDSSREIPNSWLLNNIRIVLFGSKKSESGIGNQFNFGVWF